MENQVSSTQHCWKCRKIQFDSRDPFLRCALCLLHSRHRTYQFTVMTSIKTHTHLIWINRTPVLCFIRWCMPPPLHFLHVYKLSPADSRRRRKRCWSKRAFLAPASPFLWHRRLITPLGSSIIRKMVVCGLEKGKHNVNEITIHLTIILWRARLKE